MDPRNALIDVAGSRPDLFGDLLVNDRRLGEAHARADPVTRDRQSIGGQRAGQRVDDQVAIEHGRAGDIEDDESRGHARRAVRNTTASLRRVR